MRKLTFLFALLCVSVMGWAVDYCNTVISSVQGNEATVTMRLVSGTTYEFSITTVKNITSFNTGSNFYANKDGEGGYHVSENLTRDGNTLSVQFTSTSTPSIYANALFIVLEGTENQFNIPTDASWAACAGDGGSETCTDVTAPTISNVASSAITYNSATLTVTASDDVAVTRYVVKNGDTQLASGASNEITLTGLTSGTTYDNLKVYAYDACGNESSAFAVASFETSVRQSVCEDSRGHLGSSTKRVNYEIVYDNGTVTYTLSPYNSGDAITYAEVQFVGGGGYAMTINEGVATYQQTSQVEGSEKYLRFLYETSTISPDRELTSQDQTSDPNIIYYKVGDCSAGGAANPHLTLTNPTKSSVLLPVGETITVGYTSDNTAAATITSSESSVASVSGSVVTAVAKGEATITVSQEATATYLEAFKSFDVNVFDWDDIEFLTGSGDKYKFNASSSNVRFDNITSKSGHTCIHLVMPSADGLGCSLTTGTFEWEGAGLFIYTENISVRQTKFTVSWNGNVYDCYVYYDLDETAPVILEVEVSSTYNKAVITITADEAFVSAEVFNNGSTMGTFTPAENVVTITGLEAETKYDKLTVKVTDAAGNVSDAAAVPEFTTAAAPSISEATYNGYATNDNFYIKYAITRTPSKELVFTIQRDFIPVAGVVNPQLWINNSNQGQMTADGNNFTMTMVGPYEDETELTIGFRTEYSGAATNVEISYTVGSEQAAPASIPAAAVVLNKASNSLSIGETDALTATVYPSFATDNTVAWSTDDEDVATVTNGTVTAVGAGIAHITATCGSVSAEYTATVSATLVETKYYGAGVFSNQMATREAFAYEYTFTRATNHNVTLDVVFSEDMSSYIGTNNFQMYVNGGLQRLTYDAATRTATYDFGSQSEGASIGYYFYFVMDGGGVHQTANATYTVGSSNEKVYACVVDEEKDNTTLLTAYDGRTADVIIDRSFAAGNLYTLVLPFDADAAQTAEQLPGQLTELSETIVKENGDLRLNFVNVSAIEAGVPYLYSPSADVTNPVFEGVTVSPELNHSTGDAHAKYYGIYAPTTGALLKETTANAYVLGSDRYLYDVTTLQDDQPMKALRCYFVLNFPSGLGIAPRARVIFNNQETETATGVESIQPAAVSHQKVLRDGQLLIIRDGKTYNAQGQLVK